MAKLDKHILLIGAVSSSPAGWYVSPHGYSLYRTAPGDTYKSLAATYLGSSAKWNDIYSIQSASWRAGLKNDPNNLPPGSELFMPAAAIAQAKGLGQVVGGKGEPDAAIEAAGTVTDAQATALGGGLPGSVTTLPEITVVGDVPMTNGKKAAIAAAAVGAVGFIWFVLSRDGEHASSVHGREISVW